MKKVSTVTFHKAQNYGSVLQTYALQQFVNQIANEKDEKIFLVLLSLLLIPFFVVFVIPNKRNCPKTNTNKSYNFQPVDRISGTYVHIIYSFSF